MIARRVAPIGALFAGLLAPAASRAADPSPAERALATSLFRAGRELMQEGKTREACEKLAESQRLDPAAGTLLNLAICHETLGLLATAWAELNDSLAWALRDGRADREEIVRSHLAALEPRLPRVTVELLDRAPSPGLIVTMDDVVLRPAALGTPIPVDPGDHHLTAKAAGRAPVELSFVAEEGTTHTVVVPALPVATRAQEATPPHAAATKARAPRDLPPATRGDHDGQLGAFIRADVDGRLRGFLGVVGASYGVGAHLEPAAGLMIGPSMGAWFGTNIYFTKGPWKPFATLAVPVYVVRVARVGVHGALGVQWDMGRHFGAYAMVGGQLHPEPPAGYASAELVPSIGVQGRL